MFKDPLLKTLVIGCAWLLSACHSPVHPLSPAGEHALVEKANIRDTASGRTLTPQQLLNQLAQAPLVIVGEEHTNAQHHQIERWLLQNLHTLRPQGSVLMEMIDLSQQEAVNRVKRASLSGTTVSATRAAETLRWNPGWPWALYRDVVMTALQAPYPLLAANLSRQQVSDIYQHPTFPRGMLSNSPQVHESLSAIIYLMHNGQIDGEQVTSMLAIQQQRDRLMATQMQAAPRPTLLIAGGYHAAKDIGVPLHLADLKAEKPLVLLLTTDGATLTAKQADYIWSVAAEK
ncbi:ChaN family lipoprotein [Klebsiella aerogenes]|uniref:ChaN family lipoprotein n=1 Tax=Klebsiella aerogenes TaxID=548 RepID=UPI001C236134|nr:ChaN family lipoprotein [Klebsiella aerogenes]QXC64223.1 ChaN family lipoprotein [Klebsiella aerogenes]HBZ8438620.1 ChaN family lipoprotein [Klebsiella aerogenes]